MSHQSVIPRQQRVAMEKKPIHNTCALYDHFGHECEGKITWEHAIIVAGKKVQKEWAIVALCEKAHAVNGFQDAGTMVKSLNEWVAYCRATDEDLLNLCGDLPGTDPNLAKSRLHFQKKKALIAEYGVWEPKINYDLVKSPFNKAFSFTEKAVRDSFRKADDGHFQAYSGFSKNKNPNTFTPDPEDQMRLKEIISFLKEHGDKGFSKEQVIAEAIRKYHQEIMELKALEPQDE